MNESKKLDHLIFFFFYFTHKGRKYLSIIEHIFYFIIPFSCQNLRSIHAFVLHTKRLQVDVDLYTRTRFFVSRFWEQISQPLFNDPLSLCDLFSELPSMVAIDKFDCITCSKISNIPYRLIFTTKFSYSSISITIISWDYLNLLLATS